MTVAGRRDLAGLAAACWAAFCPAALAFQCKTDLRLGPVAHAAKKGIAVDDNTLKWCTSQVPEQWPNAAEPMTSIRLFKAWSSEWDEAGKEAAWSNLAAFLSSKNAKVLIGTQIHCSEADDLQSWAWTKELLQRLQPHQVMGLAIGNELELLHFKGSSHVPGECLEEIWERGYLWRMFRRIVSEFDALGFAAVPVTSVFTGLGLAGNPFYEVPGKARVNSFLQNATNFFGSRFASTWNFYPYFDPNQPLDPGTVDECERALAVATCWDEHCFMPSQIRQARMKMEQLTGESDQLLWIGETGWSSPRAASLSTKMKACPAWSSEQTFKEFYQGFMHWDLSIGGSYKPPDHAFWFTMRDSVNFGQGEHFGLMPACNDPACKLKSPSFVAGDYQLHAGPGPAYCADELVYNGWVYGGEAGCRNRCTMTDRCRYYGIWPHSHMNHYWCRLTATCENMGSAEPFTVSTYERLELPAPMPSPEPTPEPSQVLMPLPSREPTPEPAAPTKSPAPEPTPEPTHAPTPLPTSNSKVEPSPGPVVVTPAETPTMECWETLTGTPDEVAVDEGNNVGQLTFENSGDCGAACNGNEQCHSFTACPGYGRKCWLKDRVVRQGDPYITVGGGCQTYLRVACSEVPVSTPPVPAHTPTPTPTSALVPATQAPEPLECWETLTGTPDEVAADEGQNVGELHFEHAGECEAACDADQLCRSFTTCPAFGKTCWLKDRLVRKGDPFIKVGGGCQTYLKVSCTAVPMGSTLVPVLTTPAPVPARAPEPVQCWETLTGTPGEVVTEEGGNVGQLTFESSEDCAAVCDADEHCHSFTACPGYGSTCWLKDKVVRKGDPHIMLGGGCQTYLKVTCAGLPPRPQVEPSLAPGPSQIYSPVLTPEPMSQPVPAPTPAPKACWNALTSVGELVLDEGETVGQLQFDGSVAEVQCGAACDANARCQSFTACPGYGKMCWLKGRVVFSGHRTVRSGGGCQTFVKADCGAGQVLHPAYFAEVHGISPTPIPMRRSRFLAAEAALEP